MSDIKPVLNNRYHAWLEQPREQTRKVRSVDDSNLYDRERQTPSRQMSLHNYPSTSRQQESPHHQQIWYPSVSAVIEENKRREGAAARAANEQRTRLEQESIVSRLREAEEEASTARRSSIDAYGEPSHNTPIPGLVSVFPHLTTSAPSTSGSSLVSIPSYPTPVDPGRSSPLGYPAVAEKEYLSEADRGGDDQDLYRHIARLSLQHSRNPSPSPASTSNYSSSGLIGQ